MRSVCDIFYGANNSLIHICFRFTDAHSIFYQLALHVLSFLEPRDLLIAAQTCKYWRILTEDNLMWREKCKEEGITEPYVAKVLKHNWRNKKSGGTGAKSTWKAAYLRHVRIETNWREGKERISKV